LKCSELRKTYPNYIISKNKANLTEDVNVDELLESVKAHFKNEKIDARDGVKIDFKEGWVHLRKSNTEPIIRIYSEAGNQVKADEMANDMINFLQKHKNK
jgi:phosphomannomutase